MQAKTLMSQEEETRKEQKRAAEPGSKFNQLANKRQAKQ